MNDSTDFWKCFVKFDMIFVSETFTSQFRTGKDTKVIGLKNLLSEKEIEAKIREALDMPAE